MARGYHPDPPPPQDDSKLPPPMTLERPPECVNRNSTPAFYVVVSALESIRKQKQHDKHQTLVRLFALWRQNVGNDLYPLIRLLIPDKDRERPNYNLKEAALANAYIEALGLEKHSEAGDSMIHWKQPKLTGGRQDSSGDFARVCFKVIEPRCVVENGQWSVEAINHTLDELTKSKADKKDKSRILRQVNTYCTALEQEWLIRIILKDLKISIREKGILQAFHPDAMQLYDKCSDLKRVCWELWDPERRLNTNDIQLELFNPFRPQLCAMAKGHTHDSIAKLVGAPHKEFIMEEKLDGERIQLHMRGNGAQWFYCSRKAKDYTYLYGAHPGQGSMTKYISDIFQDQVRNVILDGEMMVWDPMLGKYLAFGTLKTAASMNNTDPNEPRPCFKVFDILYLNDNCLIDKRLSERKRLLRGGRIFKDIEKYTGRFELVEEKVGKTGKDITSYLERIMETRGEGIVVKKPDSKYSTGSRDVDWVKVKPEYSDQMGETFDLLVLGGWWGKGGRSGKVSSLLCGLREQEEIGEDGERPTFQTFCSIGTGLRYSDYTWTMDTRGQYFKPFDRKNIPPWMKMGSIGLDDKPDVYIEPEHSFVIKVKASEIVPAAGGYGIGYTLRFPRATHVFGGDLDKFRESREEKVEHRDMWHCVSSYSVNVRYGADISCLMNGPVKKYQESQGQNKKRKVTRPKKNPFMVSAMGQVLSQDRVKGDLFDGVTFFIAKGTPAHPKAELEALVHEHGGLYSQGQLPNLSAKVISPDEKSPSVRAQIRKGVDVIKPEWLFQCIKRDYILPLIKEFLVHASAESKASRYYNRTLEHLQAISDDEEEEEEEEENVAEPLNEVAEEEEDDAAREMKYKKKKADREEREEQEQREKRKTAEQRKLEADWGMRDVPKPGSDSSDEEDNRGKYDEDEDTEDEYGGRELDGDEDDKAADSHDSDGEENGQDEFRTMPVGPQDVQGVATMGDESDAMKYDEEKIFRHLAFYLDTSENAELNGLAPSSPTTSIKERYVARVEKLLQDGGGRITTDLHDPKLTHIVMDEDDNGRYEELTKKTSKPKMKHIVLPSWVEDCASEETLLHEDIHKPK
ncbi:hypothetical protein L198_06844 [Cryptococcus wingfieldii CBS 7118]|uniref:DNA ligase n=1 Tax=Cryptococcus wingfieldii CBS 7118 TaxID=1295528 RepID=A0A1E3II32_9TREE|nr:hypothetical protein L198_06844 [Cryptococcus wingfieldii CBS 7118]ODN88085.1 hypothetical protein L198_06844 [Cryptococcus wingfieldii CBS 7118]